MKMLRKLIQAPSIEPITVEELAAHTNADDDHHDYLQSLVPRARKRFEQRSGRLLVEQTWQFALPKFCNEIHLPFAPLRSINSIKYINNLGQFVTLDSSDYRVIEHGLTATITPKLGGRWPAVGFKIADAVQIECVFGHGTLTNEGTSIDNETLIDQDKYDLAKQAILVLIADWFRNREDTAPVQLYDMPNAFKAIADELAVELL
ncbi:MULTISPECIES: phage gp6-like head-tail connector protein [unclassified Pseudoalteromonas]|uniref:head-tail connector protein n=1 Tax=unclassified Pseudoalteromonas TaxID=194690 RepID=UPI00040EE553|nr:MULTISPECIES: phage gp6-like head-tail connector protein [unclassified Pseudoalteromonas]